MQMFRRMGLLAALLLAAACSRDPAGNATAGAALDPGHVVASAGSAAPTPAMPAAHRRHGFASLPDRGELVAYPGRVMRRDGAYTRYRTELSEDHALHAIAQGHLRVTTPSGKVLDFQYDRHVEHPSGDWTWIGHIAGQAAEQAILTFGAQAAFGTIAQPGKLPLRLNAHDGASWLIETDAAQVAGIVNAATRPLRPDYKVPDRALLSTLRQRLVAASGAPKTAAATTTLIGSTPVVDVVIGYTAGFATDNGGASGAVTRLNFLVDVTNAAYHNSVVNAQARLVKTLSVNYTETNTNGDALEQLSGYRSGTGPVTPNAAFDALRAARETYGADLVSLVRKFHDPEHDGCGIAWLLGGSLQGISPGDGWDALGYSVVSDGRDAGIDGKTYYCLDETLAHELGHNMGSAHDRDAAAGTDGTLDNPDDYGAYNFSFGYKNSGYGFYTIMAYGDAGQRVYRVFSNPRITFCGGQACGISNMDDNARSLGLTIPTVAGFRATKVIDPPPPPVVARILLRQLDTNADGKSDLMFFNHGLSRVSSWYMNGTSRIALSSFDLAADYRLVDAADFDGDGSDDLLFTSNARDFRIAFGNGFGYGLQTVAIVPSTNLQPIAAGDINGDGKADIVLRDAAAGKVIIWYMSGATRIAYNSHVIAASYEFVGHGDLNGDGKQDLLWTNAARQLLLDASLGYTFTSQPLSLSYRAGYTAAGVQDVNGDGQADIVLTQDDGLRLVTWFMHGATRYAYSSTTTSAADKLVAKGDFNGDQRGDLVLMDPSTRQIRILTSTGGNFTAANVPLIPQAGSDLMDVQSQ